MYTFRRFSKKQIFIWTSKDLVFFFIISTIPVAIYYFFGFEWMVIPALPLALLGTAVAFNIGFKNSNAYDRGWEARKIWGGIVNYSRTFTIMTLDYIGNLHAEKTIEKEELASIRKRLVYRHIAWLTALRYQLRVPKEWEHFHHKDVNKYKEKIGNHVLEHTVKRVLEEFYNLQGKSERIKNYPLPRQYTSISYYFVMLFTMIVPFSMIGAFEVSDWRVWFVIPFSMMVSWVFFTMEKIGDYSENPFEGIGNDVPITSLSRTIEIDLKDMLDEKNLPDPLKANNGVVI